MRLGLLGVPGSRSEAFEAATRSLLERLRVDRAVYLGVDGTLSRAVERWALELVEGDPSDGAIYGRATERCANANPDQIDRFLSAERQRRALRVLESLPGPSARAIELLDGKVAVMLYDKADLDEEDIASASFMLFGKSAEPVVHRVGARWFLSPGSFEHAGIMLLDDAGDGIQLTVYDSAFEQLRTERLSTARAAKLKVSAGS